MTTAFATSDAVLFRDPSISLAASYVPAGGGGAVAVRVIRARGDALASFGGPGIARGTNIFDLRVADVAAPAEGATLTVTEHGAGTTYRVRAVTPDTSRLVWRLDCDRL